MKCKEMRKITIIYCDFCGKEIKNNSHTLKCKNKIDKHFCKTIKKGEKYNCLIKFRKQQMKDGVV